MSSQQPTIIGDASVAPAPGSLRGAIIAAYVAAALFFVHISLYFVQYAPSLRGVAGSLAFNEVDATLGVVEHLLLFPVIAALPAPIWAKQAGYGWLVIDMATNIVKPAVRDGA